MHPPILPRDKIEFIVKQNILIFSRFLHIHRGRTPQPGPARVIMHATLAWLLCFSISVAGDPLCSNLFGSPIPSQCDKLVWGLNFGWPGEKNVGTDRRAHLFTVANTKVPIWVTRWNWKQRVYLPLFTDIGESFSGRIPHLIT
jgi:hypothetical protein